MLIEMVVWWYTSGFIQAMQRAAKRLIAIWRMFSILIIIRTLFSPWKRIISPPGKSLEQIFRAWVDNLISRLVGFVVRIIVIFMSLVICTGMAAFGVVSITFWLLLPIIPIISLIMVFTS